MNRWPLATIALVLACLLVHMAGGTSTFAYDREHLSLLRFATASFTHYDWLHLAGNLAVLSLLGGIVERRWSASWVACLCGATILSTMLALHALLPACLTYAGASSMNYALLAFMLCSLEGRRKPLGMLLLGIIAAFQLMRMDVSLTLAPVQPVWQMHLLAMSIGIAGWLMSVARESAALKRPRSEPTHQKKGVPGVTI